MNLNKIAILHIEDNLDDKIIMEEYLYDSVDVASYTSCSKLKEAQKLIKLNKFDLIFLDLSLPDAHGVDGVKKLISLTKSAIPIIVLTGLNDNSTTMEALMYGVQDFLIKGDFTPILLKKAILYAIERHKVQLELILKNQEIEIAKNRLSKAEEMATIGSWEIDLNSNLVNLSNGMKYLLCISKDANPITLKDFSKYIIDKEKHTYIDSLLSHSGNYHSREIETNFVKETGEVLTTLCRLEVIFDTDNTPIKIYGITLDITRIKEAEQVKEKFTNELANKVKERTTELEDTKIKLEESLSKEKELGELKSRFVSTASHQFRTPLTVIQSNIGLLEMQTANMDAQHLKIVEKISARVKREVVRMTSIMNEVLILGKISSGVILPTMEMTSLVKICEHVIKQHNHIQEDGRKTTLEIEGTESQINLDKNLFEQAMSNMISNAFKYSKGAPPPEVYILFQDNNVNIQVVDYGMGIPKSDLKNLFTPFFRATNVLDIPGNGLGTSIMKEYIEINNGILNVQSALNHGTTFSIDFTLE